MNADQSKSEFEHERRVAVELARQAGAVLLDHYRQPFLVEQKINALDEVEEVTAADRAANELIVNRLRVEFPDDGVLAEESSDSERRLTKDRVWLVDPMDGTNSFIAGDGDFAVHIGLAVKGEGLVGAVYQPVTDVLYNAAPGSGAWIEQKGLPAERMHVSRRTELHEMVLASSRSHRGPRMDQLVRAFSFSDEIRRGSVGIKIGLIAERHADLYIHLSRRTKQWDTCAPEAILHEAGGLMTDLFGQRLIYNAQRVDNRNGIVATNGAAHAMVLERLAPLLREWGCTPV
jgi:3'(2'), 5'-bisphosphate nucleotidase